MSSKKFITRLMLICMALVSVLSMVGCKEEGTPMDKEILKFKNQYKNIRYYVQQGYPDGWIVNSKADQYYLKKIETTTDSTEKHRYNNAGLIAQFLPDNTGKAKYSIYSLEYPFMRSTPGELLYSLYGGEKCAFSDLEFNKLFVDSEDHVSRDAFVWLDTIENTKESLASTTKYYNKIPFLRLAYTFTVDGVDWHGMMLMTTGTSGFYLITMEAENSVWEENYTKMDDLIGDFRMLGWEEQE